MARTADVGRGQYVVDFCFPNPNADFTEVFDAGSVANALWVAAEWRSRQLDGSWMAQIANVRRVTQ